MLKLRKQDFFTLGIIAAIVTVLIIVSRDKAKQVPRDDRHRAFFAALEQGRGRAAVERECATCHNPKSLGLLKKHPPKDQCLICHKLGYRRD